MSYTCYMSSTGWQESSAHPNHSGTQAIGGHMSTCALIITMAGEGRIELSKVKCSYLLSQSMSQDHTSQETGKVQSYYMLRRSRTGIFTNSPKDDHNANF